MSMAKVLDVPRTGFYKYLESKLSVESSERQRIKDFVFSVWNKQKAYGRPRLLPKIQEVYPEVGERRLRKFMKSLKIQGLQAKPFRVATTDSKHNGAIAPNLLERNFKAFAPNKAWVSDVTFIRLLGGWIYLCVILDLYSRKVVAWKLSDHNDSQLIADSLQNAFLQRQVTEETIFHSDRGSNYCSSQIKGMLEAKNIRISMSRKGNCWDNAVAESFFGTLKREMEFNIFQNLSDAKKYIFEFIEVYYNRGRMHSYLGYMSPTEFEEKAA